jgi:hypothetical protein
LYGGVPGPTSGGYNWQFDGFGNIILPQNVKIGDYPGQGYISTTAAFSGAQVYLTSTDGNAWVGVENGVPSIGSGPDTSWVFNTGGQLSLPTNGNIAFPDTTVQQTAFQLQGVAPNSPWGTYYPAGGGIANMDYQFYFDGTTGYPCMLAYAPSGGNPIYSTIWSYESTVNGTQGYDNSGSGPIPITSVTPVVIFNTAMAPGDWATVRIQCLDTDRIYRVTYLGSYNVVDEGNETKYGSITVERLF